MPSIESYELLLRAVRACEDKKAEDVRILALDPTESGLSDYFVVCSGTNTRQNVAITDEVELQLKREFGVYPNSVEGRREGDWILMDYVDFILHVFTPEKRAFYGLERLRKSATAVSPDELDAELKTRIKEQTGATRSKATPAAEDAETKRSVVKRVAAAAKGPGKKTAAKVPAPKADVAKGNGKASSAGKTAAPKRTVRRSAATKAEDAE